MPEPVTVATYNTRNLFDSYYPDSAKPPSELRALARVVDRLAPDVLGLQEVESEAALDDLNALLERPFTYAGLIEGNSYRGIDVAFMARFDFSMISHAGTVLTGGDGQRMREYASKEDFQAGRLSPLRFQRDWLLAEFDLGRGGTLAAFNGHLKSRSERSWNRHDADTIRAAEARAAARIVRRYLRRNPGTPVVILGDFNQRSGAASIAPLMGLPGFSDPVAEEILPRRRNATTYWPRRRDRIDYVLLSESARARYEPGSALITTGATAKRASDHYPVSVRLRR